jgi:hypothetical protein
MTSLTLSDGGLPGRAAVGRLVHAAPDKDHTLHRVRCARSVHASPDKNLTL